MRTENNILKFPVNPDNLHAINFAKKANRIAINEEMARLNKKNKEAEATRSLMNRKENEYREEALSNDHYENMLYTLPAKELDKLPGIMYHIIMRYIETPYRSELQECVTEIIKELQQISDYICHDFSYQIINTGTVEDWKEIINVFYNFYDKYKNHPNDEFLQTTGQKLTISMMKINDLYYSMIG